MPGWHDATRQWQEAGDVRMVGIIQEQHPDRARLFMQWKQMGWPLLVDSLNLLEVPYVPITLAVDEHGVVRAVQPRLEELERFRAEFVEVDFPAPDDGAAVAAAGPDGDAGGAGAEALERAEALFLAAGGNGGPDLDAVVEAFDDAVSAAPDDPYTLFRAGVAYRLRYDSPERRGGDFQRAVSFWERALDVDPNNYIFRRRIQQYGPRLDKPYPFYDWVRTAREEIRARGERPAPLDVEPRGSEFASPSRELVESDEAARVPDDADRIHADPGRFILTEATLVPGVLEPGEATRAHVAFVPNDAIKAHWNNEVDDLVFWIEPPAGWAVDRRVATVPRPPETVSREPRHVEIEIRAPDDADPGTYSIPAHALYYVCEDVNGICVYRRGDLELELQVEPSDEN